MARKWTDRDLRTCDTSTSLRRVLEEMVSVEIQEDEYTLRRSFEAEVLITETAGTSLMNLCPEILSDAETDTTRVKGEFQPYQAEVAPPDGLHLRLPHETRREIVRMMTVLNAAIERAGGRMTTIADGRAWDGSRMNVDPSDPRHRKMVDERMPGVFFGASACALQNHTAHVFPLNDKLMWARLLIEQHAPLLLAAAANSYNATDRVASIRYFRSGGIWSFGTYHWETVDAFVEEVYHLLRISGLDQSQGPGEFQLISGPWDLHAWVKICQPTLEQRVMDMCGDVREIMSIHAVCHSLAIWAYDQARRASSSSELHLKTSELSQRLLRHALEATARFGLSRLETKIVSPYERKVLPLGDAFSQMRDHISPIMSRLGYGWEEAYFFGEMIGKKMNGAERQKTWWNEGKGSALYVLERDNRHMVSSLALANMELPEYERISREAMAKVL